VVAAAIVADQWTDRPQGIDLLRSVHARVSEARAAGVPLAEGALVKPQRIRNVVRDALPASPPSLYRFLVNVPRGGRLQLAAGIPAKFRESSGVEFRVGVRDGSRDKALLSQLVDPANRPEHRQWLPLAVDLADYAGRKVEIVLETRAFEEDGAPDRAFWGNPTITVGEEVPRPLVLVYLVDTLRADHLPLYGYARETAPHLTAFARDAVVFDQAIASSSWTKPSVASLFTSLPPRDHGCVQFYTPLDERFTTLAERMRDHGYATGAVVANSLVQARKMSFDQGFSYFASPASPQGAAEVVDGALAFLDARKGQPAFLYLHTMDAHTPYRPPPPFDAAFRAAGETATRAAEPSDYRKPRDLARIVAQYDGAVAYGDREFGRLMSGLRQRGLYDGALVVFVSDHGEEFLEHDGWVHGHTLYDELVRVPLVVKYPGQRDAGRRVTRQVQLVDVLPTVLKSQGMAPAVGIAGQALDDSFEATGPERIAVFETKYREHVAYGARADGAKYVRHVYPESAERVFDLRGDPGEKRGRPAASSETAAPLKRAAEAGVSLGAFRHRLRASGDAVYELRLRTAGWLEVLERTALGSNERAEVTDGGQVLALRLTPAPGRPREVEFLTRPHGVPVWVDGEADDRRLRPSEIRVAEKGVRARRLPFLFPEVEHVDGLFAPPTGPEAGLSIWLVRAGGQAPAHMDDHDRAGLAALGYLK
jgi:arylsulfatase A-like enzyme